MFCQDNLPQNYKEGKTTSVKKPKNNAKYIFSKRK